MICPVNYISLTQDYSSKHKGLDLGWYGNACGYHQPVYACDDGVVIYNRYQKTGGYTIIIKHYNGFCSVYGHLKKDSQQVREKTKVTKGQFIAQMGDSGITTGYHLHFAIYKGTSISFNKKLYVDPKKYINVYSFQKIKDKCKDKFLYTKKCTAKDGLNIRSLPNVKSKKVGIYFYNQEVEAYGSVAGWVCCDNCYKYYVAGNFLK